MGCNQGCLVKKGGLVADEGNHIVHASGGALDSGMICVVLLKVILVDGYVDGTAEGHRTEHLTVCKSSILHCVRAQSRAQSYRV